MGHLPLTKSMSPPLVGNGSPGIFEENVSSFAREWSPSSEQREPSTIARDLKVFPYEKRIWTYISYYLYLNIY